MLIQAKRMPSYNPKMVLVMVLVVVGGRSTMLPKQRCYNWHFNTLHSRVPEPSGCEISSLYVVTPPFVGYAVAFPIFAPKFVISYLQNNSHNGAGIKGSLTRKRRKNKRVYTDTKKGNGGAKTSAQFRNNGSKQRAVEERHRKARSRSCLKRSSRIALSVS